MADNKHWTTDSMPDQTGTIAIVTGANSGLGYETTLALAGKGARVVMACRDTVKGTKASREIRSQVPNALLDVLELDLASLDSIRQFARAFQEDHRELHLLVNNAGIMHIPYRQTADGFEMQFGTNHLGHFALTGLLLDALLGTPGARVVTVSSMLHRGASDIDLDLIRNGRERYDRRQAYSQSKLANLLFAYELQRRFQRWGAGTLSVAAHPGYAATNLQFAGPEMTGSSVQAAVMSVANKVLAQSAAQGALPTLYAATAADVNGCDFIGPDGFMGVRGYPAKVRSSDLSYDPDLAARLWAESEALTGVTYPDMTNRRPASR
jgi:hypothetical protein